MILNKYKIVNRKRFYSFLFVTLLLISIIFFTLLFSIRAYSKEQIQYDYICVKEGDTLWNIAQYYNYNIDIRKFVTIIKKENSLKNSIIYPGDVLKIPHLQ